MSHGVNTTSQSFGRQIGAMANNFQQMGMVGGAPMMMQQSQQQVPNPTQAIQHILMNQIRGSQKSVGWQASASETERFGQVWHM